MKSYSALNLLQEKMKEFGEDIGLLSLFASNHRNVTFSFDYYDFLRGKVFIEDLHETYEDVPYSFDISSLIYMLYKDFLAQVKKGVDFKQVSDYLMFSKKNYLENEVVESRTLKALSPTLFSMESVEEEIPTKSKSKNQKAYITIKMRTKDVLRGEIFLHDLVVNTDEDFHLTVEELITILYLDFIKEVRTGSNTTKIQKNILQHINLAK